VDKVTCYKTVK